MLGRTSWSGSISERIIPMIRANLCRGWRPGSATLHEALRVAFLIDLSTTSAVESIELIFDTLGPAEPTEGAEVDDDISFLVEARR